MNVLWGNSLMATEQTTKIIRSCLLRLREGDVSARNQLLTVTLERLEEMARRQIYGRYPSMRGRAQSVLHETMKKILDRWDYFFGEHSELGPIQCENQYFHRARLFMQDVLVDMLRNQRDQVCYKDERVDDVRRLDFWLDYHAEVVELPEDLRMVVDLRGYHGLKHREVGECLGITERQARALWARARMRLSERLTDYEQRW